MKTINYKIILFFILFISVKNSYSQDNNPTLNETVTWIEGKLNYFDKDFLTPNFSAIKLNTEHGRFYNNI